MIELAENLVGREFKIESLNIYGLDIGPHSSKTLLDGRNSRLVIKVNGHYYASGMCRPYAEPSYYLIENNIFVGSISYNKEHWVDARRIMRLFLIHNKSMEEIKEEISLEQ